MRKRAPSAMTSRVAAQGRKPQRHGHPGARLVPDAGFRGPVHHARPALPGDRRPALLRAAGNPRRDGLFPGRGVARQRPRLRADRQCAQARHRRELGEAAARDARDATAPRFTARRASSPTATSFRPRPARRCPTSSPSFARWRQLLDGMPHTELAEIVLDESGYTQMWQNDKSPEAPGSAGEPQGADPLDGRVRDAWPGFSNMSRWSWMRMSSDSDEKVNIMTLHSAKGLEFGTVFLPGWEEGLFPHQRSLDENGRAGLEEERRLAYVGITRAKRRAIISFAQNRRVHNLWQIGAAVALHRRIAGRPYRRGRAREQAYGGYGVMPLAAAGSTISSPSPTATPRRAGSGPRSAMRPARRCGRPRASSRASLSRSETAGASFSQGDRVFHQKFGYGRITPDRGQQAHHRFRQGGRKAGDRQLRRAGLTGAVTSAPRR